MPLDQLINIKNEYVKKHIIPIFQPLTEQPVYCTIFSVNGSVLFTTNYMAKSLGFSHSSQLEGLSYANPPLSYVDFACKTYKLAPQLLIESCMQIHNIIINVVSSQLPQCYIDILPNYPQFTAYRVSLTPLFNHDGEIVAILCLAHKHHLLGLSDLLVINEELLINNQIIIDDNAGFTLAPRQHEVLFLLCNGFSETMIARMLNISRSSVNTILNQQIMPKFNLKQSLKVELIKLARKQNFHQLLPKSLLRRFILVETPDREVI